MGNLTFGRSQKDNPTPAWIGRTVGLISIISGITLGWVSTTTIIPQHTADILTGVLGLLVALSNGLKPYFGVETPQKSVPTEDVTEIETKKD